DLSDGLQRDLPRLCAASGVGADVDPALLPLHPVLRGRDDALALQVAAGDDYELLFTTPPGVDPTALAAAHGVQVTAVGQVTEAPGARLRGRPWPKSAWAHFGERP